MAYELYLNKKTEQNCYFPKEEENLPMNYRLAPVRVSSMLPRPTDLDVQKAIPWNRQMVDYTDRWIDGSIDG